MSTWTLDEEDAKIVRRAAEIVSARHNSCDLIAAILTAQFTEVAIHTPSTGGHGYVQWCAAMQTLGEMIVSLAKQEARKAKDMGCGDR